MAGERALGKRLAAVVAAGTLLALAGCESTITNARQNCQSTGGLLQDREMSCTGSAETVRGTPLLSIADLDEEFDGVYQLDATFEVAEGEVDASITNADGEEVGGTITPDEPLQISETVELGSLDEELDVSLEVLGGEEAQARDLRYEATITP